MDYTHSFETSPKVNVVNVPQSLPKLYGEDTLVLMARDPWWGFAYWEITPQTAQSAEKKIQGEKRIVLRVYQVSGNQSIENAEYHVDYDVGTLAGSWYLELKAPDKSFVAEIGYLTSNGKFIPLLCSNAIHLPRADMAESFDADWMVVEEEFMRIYKLSGGGTQAPSSEALAPLAEELRRLIARRMKGEAVSGGLSASAFGSAGLP
jgi:hypothetical protein